MDSCIGSKADRQKAADKFLFGGAQLCLLMRSVLCPCNWHHKKTFSVGSVLQCTSPSELVDISGELVSFESVDFLQKTHNTYAPCGP